MLSESERAQLREIEKSLGGDPEFARSFRGAMSAPTRRSRTYAELAAGAVLLAVVLVIVGVHGAAALVVVSAVALGLASYIESRAPSTATEPVRPPDQRG
ncbi:DUF3040 domain-containing protein [Actinophytocola sp. KF-1]